MEHHPADLGELLGRDSMPEAAPDAGVVALRQAVADVADLLGGVEGEPLSLREVERSVTYLWGTYWSGHTRRAVPSREGDSEKLVPALAGRPGHHRGELQPDGTVVAVCGAAFRPRALHLAGSLALPGGHDGPSGAGPAWLSRGRVPQILRDRAEPLGGGVRVDGVERPREP